MTAKDKERRFAQAVQSGQEVARKVRAITHQTGTSIPATTLAHALNGLREAGARLQANLASALEVMDSAAIDAAYNARYAADTGPVTGLVAQIASADAVQGAAIRAEVEANGNAVGTLIASRASVYNPATQTFEPGAVETSEITDLLARFADLEAVLTVVPEE